MGKVNKFATGIVATVAALSFNGCNIFEDIPKEENNSVNKTIVDDIESIVTSTIESTVTETTVTETTVIESNVSETSLVDYSCFSDLDNNIYSSIERGYMYLTHINMYSSWHDILMTQLGTEFKVYDDRYVSVFDVTTQKYSEAMEYYKSGDVDNFRSSYCDLVFNPNNLNIQDLMNVMSSKVNSYKPGSIKDSSNYQFGNHEVTIDGVNIKGLIEEPYDKTKVVEIMDLFDKYSAFKRGEYSFEQYASYSLYYVPCFLANEANKQFNTTRLGIDEASGQIYSYNILQLKNIIKEQKEYLAYNRGIYDWTYNREHEVYFVDNYEGNKSILENGSLCERYIYGIDYTKDTLLKRLGYSCFSDDYFYFDYSKFKSFYDDCLECRFSNKLVK